MDKKNILLNWVFPRRCPVCDDIVMPAGQLVCARCHFRFGIIGQPHCMKCGKPLEKEEKEYCRDCSILHRLFVKGRALYSYPVVAESLYRFKYAGRAEYADFYAQEIRAYLGPEIHRWKAEGLVPVPLHASKLRIRGYNQAEILAEAIGREMELPVYPDFIKRIRKTKPLKELNPEERQNNLKRAFKITSNDVKLKTIIIIDDIFTTGSTIQAITIELDKINVEKVYFITVAIGNL